MRSCVSPFTLVGLCQTNGSFEPRREHVISVLCHFWINGETSWWICGLHREKLISILCVTLSECQMTAEKLRPEEQPAVLIIHVSTCMHKSRSKIEKYP
ncbi:hypothetical protein cypCar_00033857 [Cyprinus carpio]|nr:hypothetical protein cypCar_00033857 [Cyprinus carpio]